MIRLLISLLVSGCIVITATIMYAHSERDKRIAAEEENKLTQESALALLEELFPPIVEPEIECKQLFGEERFVPTAPNPQVVCSSSVIGWHSWYSIDRSGVEKLMYVTEFQTDLSTAFFTTNPERVVVKVTDSNGMTSASNIIEIKTDLQPCMPPLCKRV